MAKNDYANLRAIYEKHGVEFDPEKVDAAFLKGFLSVVTLDEDGAIGHLAGRWGLKVTREQMQVWRHRDKGPAYLQHGRSVSYTVRDLDIWAEYGERRPVIAPPVPPSPK